MELALLLFLFLFNLVALAASPAEWRSRMIYQVLTDRFAQTDGSTTAPCNAGDGVYCGGTWQGIINRLDYIQDMGFTAIWISPITQNIPQSTTDGEAYHGYWQAKTPVFMGLIADKFLMVDIVVNDFAWAGNPTAVDYTAFTPFNSASYFHTYCPTDYNENQTSVEDCWMGDSIVALADVDTTKSGVINTYYAWIESLVSTYGIDGLRLDAANHVQQSFWPGFNSASGVYCVGEVDDGDIDYTCPYQNYLDGVLNYPLYFPLTAAFSSTTGSISSLVSTINQIKSTCKNTTLLAPFLENHDNPRFPSLTPDLSLAQNAIAFALLADGIPILYEGQEQHYNGSDVPYNREAIWPSGYATTTTTAPLYTFVAQINQLRNQAINKSPDYLDYMAYPIYDDSSTIAMRKGFDGTQIVGVFSNLGAEGASYSLTLPDSGYTSGEVAVEILSCANVTVDASGDVAVAMGQGLPKIFYPAAQLTGSGICGY